MLEYECKICHYWYFKDIDFKYEPYLCNGCHGLIQKAMSFNDVAIVYVKGSAYRIYFWYMSKDDAINIINDYFLLYIKMSESTNFTYYQRNRELILNIAKDYYNYDKERLKEKTRDWHRTLSDKHKNKKKKCGKSRYHNMSEEKKQKLKE